MPPMSTSLDLTISAFDAVFADANHAVTVADPAGDDMPLIYVNDAFCKLTGYSRYDLIGNNCRFLQGPATDREFLKELKLGLIDGDEISCILANYRKDGSEFVNILYLGTIGLSSHRQLIIGCQNEGFLRDEHKRLQGSLRAIRDQFPDPTDPFGNYLRTGVDSYQMRFEAVAQRMNLDPAVRNYLRSA